MSKKIIRPNEDQLSENFGRSKEELKRDFGKKGSTYHDRAYRNLTSSSAARIERLSLTHKLIRDRYEDSRILDVGCGPSILFDDALPYCKKYLAMDLVESNLARVQEIYSDPVLETRCIDLDQYRCSGEKFDLILAMGSLEYVTRPLDVLLEMLEDLAAGGRLVVSFPNSYSPVRRCDESLYLPARKALGRMLGRPLADYPRHLVKASSVQRRVEAKSEAFSATVVYFAHRIFPQPFSRITWRLENSLSRLANRDMERRNKRRSVSSATGTEFLLVVDKRHEAYG